MSSENSKKIIIIGGGVIGVSTSWYLLTLAKRYGLSIHVELLERHSIAGQASGKAGGFLASEWCAARRVDLLARRGFLLHQALADELGAERLEYRRLDTFLLNESKRTRSALPVPSWLDGMRAQSLSPIGTVENTAQVHPFKLTHALYEECAKFPNFSLKIEAADGIRCDSEHRVRGVSTVARGDVDADVVALCMGPWTSLAAQWIQDRLPKKHAKALGSIHGSKAHSVVYRFPAATQATVTPTALFGEIDVYPRPSEVYCCDSEAEEVALPENPAEITPNPLRINHLVERSKEISSLFENPPEIANCCFLPSGALDGEPILGPILPNLFIAAGHSCWGILMGPMTGFLLAHQILHLETHLDDECLSILKNLAIDRF